MGQSGSHIGLALGSGVARGWAHIGVLRALERCGIKPDIVCGTSIGALIGGVYLGGRLDALEAWARQLTKLRLSRLFDFQLGYGGLIAGRRIMEIFDPQLRDQQIEALPARFACVTTEYGTGHEVWLQAGNLLEAVRASYALPGLFPPVSIDGRWLLDGALVNPVPVSVCRALGARIVIAVNLNADAFGQSTAEAENDSRPMPPAAAGAMNGMPGVALVRQRHVEFAQHRPGSLDAVAARRRSPGRYDRAEAGRYRAHAIRSGRGKHRRGRAGGRARRSLVG